MPSPRPGTGPWSRGRPVPRGRAAGARSWQPGQWGAAAGAVLGPCHLRGAVRQVGAQYRLVAITGPAHLDACGIARAGEAALERRVGVAEPDQPAQARVDLGVVLRVEPRVGPVMGAVERQHVHAAEQPVQRTVEQSAQYVQVAAETIRVRDQLNAGWHATPHYPSG